jgi:peptidoglycan/xylan/chitin deacetylase (PgdA/CDA1 family)
MSALKALPILMYHHVSPAPGLVTVSPATFRDHMQTLAHAGWRSAGLAEVEQFLAGKPLPAKTCVISFDDGYLDNYLHAHPVLVEFGLKAVLFVVTGWLGDGPARRGADLACPDHNECKRLIAAGEADRAMARWSELEEMAAAGSFEFHSHTQSHTRWDREIADAEERDARLAQDLATSRAALRERLGIDSRHLCWPQGYYDEAYLRVARAAGFDYLYTTEKRINTPDVSPQHLGRVVTKEKPGGWLASRLGIYSRPWLGRLYVGLNAK